MLIFNQLWLNNNLIEGLVNENEDNSLITTIIDYYYEHINPKTDIIKKQSSLILNDKIPLQIYQMWHSS